MKIAWGIAKLGKGHRYVFDLLDADQSSALEPLEILDGLKSFLGVCLGREETHRLCEHLDEDGSGDVDYKEFNRKITTERLVERCEGYTISQTRFIEKVLAEWTVFKDGEKAALMTIFDKFVKDRGGKGIGNALELCAFESLMHDLEPGLSSTSIRQLFKTAVEVEMDDNRMDHLHPETLHSLITEHKIGGYGKEFFSDYLASNS